MTDTAGERLDHQSAMDCIFGALSVTVLGYEEAIHAYLRLRDIGDWREREDNPLQSGIAEILNPPTMTNQPDATIVARLKEACNGHPSAKIPWPHRLLHDAIEEIEAAHKLIRIWKAVAQITNTEDMGDKELRLDRDRWKKLYEDERLSKMNASYDQFGDHR